MTTGKGQPLSFELDDEDQKLFCDEADEQLQFLDIALVQLEGEPDPELVQRIFRAAHTLKGSSATIGHTKMAALTHAMETVLDAVRQGQAAPTAAVVDSLLAGLDALRVLAREVVTRVDSGTETAPLEAALLAAVTEPAVSALASGVPAAPGPALRYGLEGESLSMAMVAMRQGRSAHLVELTIADDCQLPSIRCYQALQELEAVGMIAAIWPDRVTIEAGGGDHTVAAVLLTTADDLQLRDALAVISDVSSVSIRQLDASELGAIQPLAPDVSGDSPAARPALAVVEHGAEVRPLPRQASQSVRIDVERLDGLMDLVGELVIDRTRLQQIRLQLSAALKDKHLSQLTENFEETTTHLARVTDELQEEIMRTRMLPVRSVLTRLPRLVRDVAARCGKQVELLTSGEETELDRSVIEELSDPLVHILRNAVDHGIETPEERRAAGKPETGLVHVTAWSQEAFIYISVRDDGRGIDTAALRRKAIDRDLVPRELAEAAPDGAVLQYIFFAGLSTATAVSDVSGRGVGMDIVRSNIERLNGHVHVTSVRGEGSEFVIQLPLTLATTRALMVRGRDTVFAIPLTSVTEALAEQDADIHAVAGNRTLRFRGRLLPVLDLAATLGDRRPRAAGGEGFIVATRHGDRQVAFVVDALLGEQDVVVKPLGELVGKRHGLTGATILGDGTLGLIVDTASLVAAQPGLAAIA